MENKPTAHTEVGSIEQAVSVIQDAFRADAERNDGTGRFARFMIEAMPGVIRAMDKDITRMASKNNSPIEGGFAATDVQIKEFCQVVGLFIGNTMLNTALRIFSCQCESCTQSRGAMAAMMMEAALDAVKIAEEQREDDNDVASIFVNKDKKQH